MNFYSILGFILAVLVLGIGLYASSPDDLTIFGDLISIFIVLGGTLAATSISFQLNKVFSMVKIFFYRVIKGSSVDYVETIKEIINLSEIYRKTGSIEQTIGKCDDFFIKEGLTLIQDEIMSINEVLDIMKTRSNNIHIQYSAETQRFKSIGKYPPAFGMMGTTIGMIVLLANLGGADAMKSIGPAMGVCLITTLYGVVIANLVVVPIAENLEENSRELYRKNQIAVEGLSLITKKLNPIVLAERLNSFLLPSERLDWKNVVK